MKYWKKCLLRLTDFNLTTPYCITEVFVINDSCNGLLSDSTQPLLEPMLTYHQRLSLTFETMKLFTWIHKISTTKLSCLKFTPLKSQPHLLWGNELRSVFLLLPCSMPTQVHIACNTTTSQVKQWPNIPCIESIEFKWGKWKRDIDRSACVLRPYIC